LMVGALTSFSLMVLSGMPFLAALVAVIVLMSVMGIVTERVAIRPLRQLLSVGWILSTVGVSVILKQFAEIYWGREQKRVPSVIFAHSEMGALLGLKAFAVAIIGGLGNPFGILIAGLALGVAEFIVAGYNASLRDAVTFFLLILILAWRPQGLFQRVTAEKV